MKRGHVFALLVIFTGAALLLGVALTFLGLERARLGDRPFGEDSSANASARKTADLRREWGLQLSALRSTPEPTSEVLHGVYLARISAVGGGSGSFVADWLGTEGTWGEVVVNRSSFRQRLSLQPIGTVLVQRPVGNSSDGFWGPEQVDVTHFFSDLSSNRATGAALGKANWWVTVWNGQCVQLIEEPGQERLGRPPS